MQQVPMKQTTLCKLCAQPFEHFPLELPIVGMKTNDGTIRIVTGLMLHLQTDHADVMAKVNRTMEGVLALLILDHYQTPPDPNLTDRLEMIRHNLYKHTQKFTFSDGQITALAERLDADDEGTALIVEVLKAMRDTYEESGQFAPGARLNQTSLIV